ncbi:MAG: thioredoxin-dependent thiol peroxidase [Anaerolineales bacterium]|nr:thioredoxin-dependent thiol peroxidase [Anaerolineales bacterium]
MPVSAGTLAPDFMLFDETGTEHRLSGYHGKTVILYFYPKDDTPGCTKEACSFRDALPDFHDIDAVVLGVSPDTPKSHARFKEKFSLNFPLLADAGHKICDAYGVWGPKNFMGKEYEGVLRTTFVVDPKGRIARVFENVKPAEHGQEVLDALKEL